MQSANKYKYQHKYKIIYKNKFTSVNDLNKQLCSVAHPTSATLKFLPFATSAQIGKTIFQNKLSPKQCPVCSKQKYKYRFWKYIYKYNMCAEPPLEVLSRMCLPELNHLCTTSQFANWFGLWVRRSILQNKATDKTFWKSWYVSFTLK